MNNNKLWGGRFSQATNCQVEEFTASIGFDKILAPYDILGSLAHVKMLGHCSVLTETEVRQISQGLLHIANAVSHDEIKFSLSDEDIHLNIERILAQQIGEVAGKLHTARSRNDQVALDLHLYLRDQILVIMGQVLQLQATLLEQAKLHLAVIMPGYTHLQRAQPILFSHHLLAYVAMLQRDFQRLQDGWARINVSPLGAGALAGTTFPIDPKYTASLLGFSQVYSNSMDAVSDRDFVIEFLANASILMQHLSRFCEELILWSSQEFQFIELADAYCTGSSIMPQKKNPDVPELIRGKTGRVYGALINLLTIMKGLPLSYNKDLQEDKEPLFDVCKTLQMTLPIFSACISTMKVKAQQMRQACHDGWMNATDLADYLVNKGMSFREAHAVAGQVVQYCVQKSCAIDDLNLTDLHRFSSLFAADVFAKIELTYLVNQRRSDGATGNESVATQLQKSAAQLEQNQAWVQQWQQKFEVLYSELLSNPVCVSA